VTVEAQLGLMTRLQMTGRRETGSDGIGRQDESVSTNKRAKSAKGARLSLTRLVALRFSIWVSYVLP